MATIRDIAAKTGFSITTISRVLREDPAFSASEETRARIHACAKELNYQYREKTPIPKTIKTSHAHRVGILPIGLESERGESQDPYYLHIRNGIESALNKANLSGTILNVDTPEDYFKFSLVDSVLVIGKKRFDEENPYFKSLQNVIFVDYDARPDRYDSVLSDMDSAVMTAVRYMQSKGCQDIGYIGSWDYYFDFDKQKMIRQKDRRERLFEAAMENRGRDMKNRIWIGEKFTRSVGYELAKKTIVAGNLPDAFLIGSDPMAIGVYRAFSEAGVKIGSEVRLVSIDDVEDVAYLNPPLTSVHLYAFEMGELAVECLKQRIYGRKVPVRIVLPIKITSRESC